MTDRAPHAPTTHPGPRPAGPRRRLWVGLTVGLFGLVLVVTASFLPWLTSGPITRNSYQASGVVDRLALAGDGIGGWLLARWVWLGPVCFLPVLSCCLRWWRVTAALTAAIGLVCGTLAVVVLTSGSGRALAGISLAPAGPATLLGGSLLCLVGGIIALTGRRPAPFGGAEG